MRQMSLKFVAVLAVLGALCVARAAEDNPYSKAKVGDWIEYTTTMAMQGQNMESSLRKEVIKKTDTEVTLELTIKMKMMPQPMKHTIVIPLDKKYTPGKPENADKDVEIKELSTGTETVTVAGKSLETKWVESEITSAKNKMTIKSKAWMSKDIPLDGLVKQTSEMPQGKQTIELKDFGSGK